VIRRSSIMHALMLAMAAGALPPANAQPITARGTRDAEQDAARLAAAEARRARRRQRRLSTATRGQGGVA